MRRASTSSELELSSGSGSSWNRIEVEDPPTYSAVTGQEKRKAGEEKECTSTASSVDPWDIVETVDDGPQWNDLTCKWKTWRVVWITIRILLVFGMLYFFICSLTLLQDGFQLLAGRAAGDVFGNNVLIKNPVSAMMIGVLVTVLVQSSSTSTSIVVSMVGAGILEVPEAIPIVMGANIGTTVTNTFVALTQSTDRDTFRRAFAGATVHDAFNWLTVLVLLPLECASHYLFRLTEAMTKYISRTDDVDNPQFLNAITHPLTNLIVQIDKQVLTDKKDEDRAKFPMAKYYCKAVNESHSYILPRDEAAAKYEEVREMIFTYKVNYTESFGTNTSLLNYTEILDANSTKCSYLFHGTGMPGSLPEQAAGGILLVVSLAAMTISLMIMVKVLNSLLKGPMARIVRKVVNAEFPGRFSYFTGYVALLFGAGITVIFQSSSVFTSTLTPLVGIGVITVERMYPLTLGSNIGTTVTSILAALAGDPSKIRDTLQISFCHLFFNISGIILYYPIPFMRVPIPIAKMLGTTTAKYRWFAIVYILAMFVLFPLTVFGLSMAGWYVLLAVGVPFLVLMAFVIIVNVLQRKKPNWLPKRLRTWSWLPKPLHSLEPYDRVFTICCPGGKCRCCCCCRRKDSFETDLEIGTGAQTSGEPTEEKMEEKMERKMEGKTEVVDDKRAIVKSDQNGEVIAVINEGVVNPVFEQIDDETTSRL